MHLVSVSPFRAVVKVRDDLDQNNESDDEIQRLESDI